MENRLRQRSLGFAGLDATAIKLIALVIMTIDHVGAFCPNLSWVSGIVYPLRLVGRIAAPLFLYCVAESLRHTSDKRRFLKRMYLASAATGYVNELVSALMDGRFSFPNIFQSFAWMILIVIVVEDCIKEIRLRQAKKAAAPVLLLLLLLAVSVLADWALGFDFPGAKLLSALIHPLIRSPLEVEYSVGLILLGTAWYFIPEKSWRCALLAALCLLCFFQFWPYTRALLMFSGIQWAMAGAIPFILLYNGRRGRGIKWLFYLYYPLNMYILALLSYTGA